MPIIRAQVSIPATTTVTEDTVTNTWHFTATDTGEGVRAELSAALVAFYEGIDAYKSPIQNWVGARVKYFNMDDAEPRVPVSDVGLALTAAPAGTPLPHEVCAVLSFHGAYVSGASQARRRGRIYVGPLNQSAISSTSLLVAGFLTALSNAGGALLAASNLASDWAWVVRSPTAGTEYPVVAGHVDNNPDTQRRRGVRATTRTTF